MIIETALVISVVVVLGAIVKTIKWRRDVFSHISRSD
jgi:hypothetical protein